MRILLVDDEKAFLVSMKKEILRLCAEKDYDVNVSMTDDPYSLLEDEQYRRNDVILLDIEMPDISGIDLAAEINLHKGKAERPYIIFVTNRDSLVFEALKEQPYSFIRKSHAEDLSACLSRIYDKIAGEDSMFIKSGTGVFRVELKDIVYMVKEKNYVIIYTETDEYRERTTIDEEAQQLLAKGFLRPHIGYLVNMKYIDTLFPQTIQLISGVQIPVSKKYRREVKQRFYDWMVRTQ